MLSAREAKVLDFGLAKSTAKSAPTEATLTQAITVEGAFMGTPQYMAPELFGGERNLTSLSPDDKSLLCGGNDIMRLAPHSKASKLEVRNDSPHRQNRRVHCQLVGRYGCKYARCPV